MTVVWVIVALVVGFIVGWFYAMRTESVKLRNTERDWGHRLANAQTERDTARADSAAADERARAALGELSSSKSEIVAANTESEVARADAASAKSELGHAKSALGGAEANADQAQAERDAARAELQQARDEAEGARGELASARGEVDSARAALVSARADVDAARSEASVARADADTARSDADSARGAADEARADADRAADLSHDGDESRGGGGVATTMGKPTAEALQPAAPVALVSTNDDSSQTKPDDLRKIEGIGPKIAELLNGGGIMTFAQLASSAVERLSEILESGGSRFRLADPGTWPDQAALAAAGDWDALESLQDHLKGGRA